MNPAHYILADQLRIGLYIFIDLPWFQHPFTYNNFRISSEDQIRTLRGLGEARFRYDPERSDTNTDQQAPEMPAPEPTCSERKEAQTTEPAAHGARQEHVQLLTEHRLRLVGVEKSFLKSSGILRNLNRNLMHKPAETLREMDGLVEQMVQAFLENPEVTLHVMGEKCADEAYSHELNVTVLSMMLTKGLGLSPEQSRLLGLGALLHDIGLMEVPDRVLKKFPQEYTKAERDLRNMHCEFGLRIGNQLGLPPDVLAIIFQHHEMADGSGYPQGVKLDRISLPARIVAMADYYDDLCNPFDPTQAMTPHEALSCMFGQRRGKFDSDILQQMIHCLGVYPPGSFVVLSNDAVAKVMSINPARPLRPWVMLYDEKVPKEEAPLLDLEQETGIGITKAIRPALLPEKVFAYLGARKRIIYFFDSSTRTPALPQ